VVLVEESSSYDCVVLGGSCYAGLCLGEWGVCGSSCGHFPLAVRLLALALGSLIDALKR